MAETLYVIDLYSLVFQVFHAIPEMTGPSGQPTNAVFGITRDLLNIFKRRPTHLLCARDSSGPGERDKLFADYKANRSAMPDELKPQIPFIQSVIEAFGIPQLELPGWEADDVLATVTEQAKQRDMDVFLVTNDKDARQLVNTRTRIYLVRKDALLGEAELLADWGIRPDQVVDFQALVGDSVDNIPGIPLVGPKKAAALLQQFGTLDNILAHAGQVNGAKLRENLIQYADQARTSRQLAELRRNLPLNVDWEAASVGHANIPRLLDLFSQFGFRRFGDEVRALPFLGEAAGGAAALPVPDQKTEYQVVDTPAALARFVEQLRAQPAFALDLETTGLDPLQSDIVGWAFSWAPRRGWYIPVRGPAAQPVLDPQTVVDTLKPILERPDITVHNQNIKYDLLVLRRAGIDLRSVGVDPMVGSYLLDAGARTHNLEELARRYFDRQTIPISDLIGKGLFQKTMDEIDIPQIAEYAVEDASLAWELADLLSGELRSQNLWDLYWNLERPLIEVLAEMQYNGIRVNVDMLRQQSQEATLKLEEIQRDIFQLAGREFNIDSPIQLRQILFDDLALPVLRKTKTGPSTDQDVLEELALRHPLPARILDHRRLAKLKNTYLDALPGMVNPRTGKIHASFNQVVAATGRLSSSDPNLQNIPIRTPEGRRVRAAFTPSEPDWELLCADYSQIELRMLAEFSQDPALRAAFDSGVDIHTSVAAEVYGTRLEEVDADMRRVAKAVNFGVIYGQSPFGLAAALGIDQGTAARFIDDYFAKYAGVDAYLRRLLEECVRTGYATTILGRRRAITGIRNTSGRQRNLPERTAINTVIQGSAADLIKQAMLKVHARMRAEGQPGRLLLQIHDELVLETPRTHLDSLARLVQEEMEHALDLHVPICVDIAHGTDWLNVKS